MAFKIYTKTGDTGETGLYGGERIAKDHPRLDAYGTVDELNSHIGLLLAFIQDDGALIAAQVIESPSEAHNWRGQLGQIQSSLFTLGSQLATPFGKTLSVLPIGEEEISFLEDWIDEMDAELPALTSFILPTGAAAVAQAHVCRTVARRAERAVVALHHEEEVAKEIMIYLNRLSDYFFTVARSLAHLRGEKDQPWIAKR